MVLPRGDKGKGSNTGQGKGQTKGKGGGHPPTPAYTDILVKCCIYST